MKFTPPNISDFASAYENHMAGDAAFRDGTKYRFVILEGELKHLYLYEGHDYCRNDFAKRAPRKAQAVFKAAMPLLPGSVSQMKKRREQEDETNKAQNEANLKRERLEQAAPAMFEALKTVRAAICKVEGTRTEYRVLAAQMVIDDISAALKLAGGGE